MKAPPNPEFEAECIRRILQGEKHLFHDLIRPCERSIYFLLFSLLRNEADAEDAAGRLGEFVKRYFCRGRRGHGAAL